MIKNLSIHYRKNGVDVTLRTKTEDLFLHSKLAEMFAIVMADADVDADTTIECLKRIFRHQNNNK